MNVKLFGYISVIIFALGYFACNEDRTTEYHQFMDGEPLMVTLPNSYTRGVDITYAFQKDKGKKYNLYVNKDGGEYVLDGQYEITYRTSDRILLTNRWGTFTFFFEGGVLQSIEQHINANTKFKIKEQKVSFNL